MKKLFFVAALCSLFVSNAQFLSSKKGLKTYNGYFTFHYDEANDKVYLEVDKLNTEFLHIPSLSSGLGNNDIGLDRGQLGNEAVVYFKKAGNKLLLVQPNLDYRANSDNVLERKSVEQAFAKSVLFGFPIKETKGDTYIVDFTPFLMRDVHGVTQRLKGRKQGNYKLDKTKSAIELSRTRAFPENVEFDVLLTFTGQATGGLVRSVTPNSGFVTVNQHHSFVKLPDDNYIPRVYDPRSGSNAISYLDYATPVQENITKRFITRHRLEKKNPTAAVGEAKEPIIYYLDNGTPEPVRSALLDGGRWWNQAFEAAGYKDAFQLKILPDDADPLDVRYNVIQWVHRSTRGWSYGASVVDPRTGEIIKGHVSLGSLRIRQDFMIAQALMNKPFASSDDNYKPMLELALARIRQLSAHEIGHTLGFAHNFAASTNDRASVMDYPHPYFEMKGNDIAFNSVYDTKIGTWDKVTVAYSYSEFPNGADERTALNKILTDAASKGLRYISDSDARPVGGAHALAHLWDNGKNAAKELNRVLDIRKKAMANFSKDNIKTNEPYSILEDVFVPLYFLHRYQTDATSKVVGGLDYNYAVKGDGQLITKTVSKKEQMEALESILNTLSAENLMIPKEKLALFPPRAKGYWRTRESFKGKTGVAFDAISVASTSSDFTLQYLLHPERASRLVQQSAMDSNQLSLEMVLTALIDNTIKSKLKKGYEGQVQRVVNYNVLKHLMNVSVSGSAYHEVSAIVNLELMQLRNWLKKQHPIAHYVELDSRINKFIEEPEKFKVLASPKIPDGSPIGSFECLDLNEE
ncbi:zinc-dependent metalloprotease [Spongiivirga citrea]|uniref:DUF5117 domain-containing protein n=1 Tax=Spongiivirga citrea TaxID=1481457 RepID=A0A6M0CRY3_9FLAO|nr:zinc-dependent metalloprotease [Spongiivirga citrea]NER16660.1 DUF5117 domain-containing protein [Spongiivirga citrea]